MKTLKLSFIFSVVLMAQAVAQDTVSGTFKIRSGQVNPGQVFIVAEVMPEFPGGETALLRYLSTVRYPAKAMEEDISGIVYVTFIVDQVGAVTDITISKGANVLLDEAVLEHIRNMPAWTPGRQNNVPVKVQLTIPVKFLLQ